MKKPNPPKKNTKIKSNRLVYSYPRARSGVYQWEGEAGVGGLGG